MTNIEGFVVHVTDRPAYSALKKVHSELSRTEQQMVIEQLGHAYSRFELEVLHVAAFRRLLYSTVNHKILHNQSIAVLARGFNMSLKGHNAVLAENLKVAIVQAFNEEQAGKTGRAVKALIDAELRMEYLTGDEIISLLKRQDNVHATMALALHQQILKYQDVLFRSVIFLATKIAKRATWRLSSPGSRGSNAEKRMFTGVIQEGDMIQEAIIAAKHAVLTYKPWIHNGASFTTYVYNFVSGELIQFVHENSRVVAVPRTVMERYLRVQSVLDNNPLLTQYDRYDYAEIARNVPEMKGKAFTAEEVEALLLNVSKEHASLDLKVADNREEDATVTLGESLVYSSASQETALDRFFLQEKLLSVIREYCSMQEFTLIKLRWAGPTTLTLDETAKKYTELTEMDMNKGKVAAIEQTVFQRLRESNDRRFGEFLSVINDVHEEGQVSTVTITDGVVRSGGRRIMS